MSTLAGLTRLFIWNSKIRLQRGMEYRFDFLAGIIISTLSSSLPPLFQYFIFSQTKGFPGWTLDQVILFQGILLIIAGLRNTIFGEVRSIVSSLVHKGDFDRLLLKPYPPIGVLMASGFNIGNMGPLVAGAIITAFSFKTMGLSIGFAQAALFFTSVVFGLVFYASIIIIYCSIALMLVYMGGIWDLFQYITRFGDYPAEIFPKVVQGIFITAVPFAVMVYYPVQILLDRADIKIALAFSASIIFLVLSIAIWNNCLKKYTSAGG